MASEETIKKYIYEELKQNWSNEIKQFEKHLKEFNIELKNKITVRELIFFHLWEGIEGQTYYNELLNGDIENDFDLYDRVLHLKDCVDGYDNETLLNFLEKEEEIFYNRDYIDSDYLIEDILYFFDWDKNEYNDFTTYCSSYQGSLDLKTYCLEPIKNFEDKYKNKNDIQEHLNLNLTTKMLKNIFNVILIEYYIKPEIDRKDFNLLIEDTKEVIKEELHKRSKDIQENINQIQKELKLIDVMNVKTINLLELELVKLNDELNKINLK